MLLADIMSFRQIAYSLLGELSPNMFFLYDIMAFVLCFIFFMIIFAFLGVVFRTFKRW